MTLFPCTSSSRTRRTKGGAMRMSCFAAALPCSSVSPPGSTTVTSSAHTDAALSGSPASRAAMKTLADSSGVMSSLSRRGAGPELDPLLAHAHAERGDGQCRDDAGRRQVGIVAPTERQLGIALVTDRQPQGRSGRVDDEIPAADDVRQGAGLQDRLDAREP